MNDAIIKISGLTKRYGEKTAVNNLYLTVEPGEVFGLLGPNGAGKTTTTLMLLGLTETTETAQKTPWKSRKPSATCPTTPDSTAI